MQIDAHHHLWRYSAEEFGWISDSMATLRRDFLPADLERELIAADVTQPSLFRHEPRHMRLSSFSTAPRKQTELPA